MTHRALKLQEKRKIIFTALSKRNFYMRFLISKHVFDNDFVPINPFMSLDYFLADIVDRDLIRNANNNLLRIADELWVYGDISDGVAAEIEMSKSQGKQIRYFKILEDQDFEEVNEGDVAYE